VGSLVREVFYRVINHLHDRFKDFRYRRRAHSRFWRAEEGIAFVLVVGTLLGLGILAATTVASSDSTLYLAQSGAAPTSSSAGAGAVTTEVVTETVKRKGRTVRVVRHRTSRGDVVRPGTTVQDLVTLPARTVRETHTVTTREIATVTAIQQVTVTVFQTVTCKPKSC
jgi:hypothetical protein